MSYVLMIDDDEDFATAAATVLRNNGHEVEIQFDVKNAVESMEHRCPDLIVLDVMFPESDSAGFQLARKIRKYDGTLRNVPILMMTAVNEKFPLGFSSKDIDDVWLPIEDFIEKPVDFDLMLKKTAALLKKAKVK